MLTTFNKLPIEATFSFKYEHLWYGITNYDKRLQSVGIFRKTGETSYEQIVGPLIEDRRPNPAAKRPSSRGNCYPGVEVYTLT